MPSSSSVTLLMTNVWWLNEIRELGKMSRWFFFHVVRTFSLFSASQSNRIFWPDSTIASFGSTRNRGGAENVEKGIVKTRPRNRIRNFSKLKNGALLF
jgi:hypothetical protein